MEVWSGNGSKLQCKQILALSSIKLHFQHWMGLLLSGSSLKSHHGLMLFWRGAARQCAGPNNRRTLSTFNRLLFPQFIWLPSLLISSRLLYSLTLLPSPFLSSNSLSFSYSPPRSTSVPIASLFPPRLPPSLPSSPVPSHQRAGSFPSPRIEEGDWRGGFRFHHGRLCINCNSCVPHQFHECLRLFLIFVCCNKY